MIDYAAILTRRYKGKEWTLDGDDYDGLTWLSDDTKPTKAALDKLSNEVAAEIITEQDAQAAAKKSALKKLAALGLTADEIAAL